MLCIANRSFKATMLTFVVAFCLGGLPKQVSAQTLDAFSVAIAQAEEKLADDGQASDDQSLAKGTDSGKPVASLKTIALVAQTSPPSSVQNEDSRDTESANEDSTNGKSINTESINAVSEIEAKEKPLGSDRPGRNPSGQESSRTGQEDNRIINAFMALTADHPIDGITAMTILLIGSFVVDRVSSFVLWLLSFFRPWSRSFPAPSTIPIDQPAARATAQTNLVIVYYAVAIGVAMVLLTFFCELQLLGALGFETGVGFFNSLFGDGFLTSLFGEDAEGVVDRFITGAIIVIGAERVAQWMQLPGTPGAQEVNVQPVLVAGELILKDPAGIDGPAVAVVDNEADPLE